MRKWPQSKRDEPTQDTPELHQEISRCQFSETTKLLEIWGTSKEPGNQFRCLLSTTDKIG